MLTLKERPSNGVFVISSLYFIPEIINRNIIVSWSLSHRATHSGRCRCEERGVIPGGHDSLTLPVPGLAHQLCASVLSAASSGGGGRGVVFQWPGTKCVGQWRGLGAGAVHLPAGPASQHSLHSSAHLCQPAGRDACYRNSVLQ